MRKSAFAFILLAGAALPTVASAQAVIVEDRGVTTGLAPDDIGIADDLRPRFREYVVQENVPDYDIPGRIVVGTTLPETGVTYYDVPQRFGANRYRYSRVNGQYILVEPRTRRVVQVIE
ncbi:MAG: DUF1236 domain-containing protein [Bradyrhizobiaceae bacterium]|nr:MAG: DUF1236 domain-containing protein [Bradyrhizobiaceae bacterium]